MADPDEKRDKLVLLSSMPNVATVAGSNSQSTRGGSDIEGAKKRHYNTYSATSLKELQQDQVEDTRGKPHALQQSVSLAEGLDGLSASSSSVETTAGYDSDSVAALRAVRRRHSSMTSAEALRRANEKKPKEGDPSVGPSAKRKNVAMEIMDVETRYVAYLKLLVELYCKGIDDVIMENKQTIKLILNQFENFYFYHKRFRKKLKKRINSPKWDPETSLLGDIFLKHTKFLPNYTQYFNNYMHYTQTVRKVSSKSEPFRKFIEQCRQNPISNKNGLESLLVMPVQQVPRYGLLLGELLKATSTKHPDYSNTLKALNLLKKIADDLNEKKREADTKVAEKKDAEKDLSVSNQALQKVRKPKLDSRRANLKLRISTKDILILNRMRDAEVAGSGVEIYSCCMGGLLCAMKVIQRGQEEEATNEKEMEMLESLPYNLNIVRYIFHDTEGEKMRIFMTRYDCNLWFILNERKKKVKTDPSYHLKATEIVNYALDIVRGLEFLHSNNIIHRDLRSDNVWGFLHDGSSLKNLAIGNFDSAKKLNKHQQAVTFIGSSAWMAPEVFNATGDEPYSFKADIWGFGMVLYELMTLTRPYDGLPNHKVTLKVMQGERPTIEANRDDLIPLIAIFEDCTELEPEKRPAPQQIKASLLEIIL